MKKSLIAVLLLMSMLIVLCAACGGSGDSAQSASPAAETEAEATLPPVTTKEPVGDDGEPIAIGADDNQAAGANVNTDWLSTLPEDRRYVEENLIGASLDELIAYLGEPDGTEYTTSCLVDNGLDGILTYGDWYVSTTVFPGDAEVVMGTGPDGF